MAFMRKYTELPKFNVKAIKFMNFWLYHNCSPYNLYIIFTKIKIKIHIGEIKYRFTVSYKS